MFVVLAEQSKGQLKDMGGQSPRPSETSHLDGLHGLQFGVDVFSKHATRHL